MWKLGSTDRQNQYFDRAPVDKNRFDQQSAGHWQTDPNNSHHFLVYSSLASTDYVIELPKWLWVYVVNLINDVFYNIHEIHHWNILNEKTPTGK